MSKDRERLRLAPTSTSPLTVVAGVVSLGEGPQPYLMSDRLRDELVSNALSNDVAGVITRGSGEPGDPRHRDLGRGYAAGWNGRQQAAASRLAQLWRAALPLRGLPKGYGGISRGGRDLSPEEADAAQGAWDDYCVAMDEVDRSCSQRHAAALRMVVVYGEPSTLDRAYLVREALSYLANWWRLK